jgi:outer membrane lipoprotein-sorting protein
MESENKNSKTSESVLKAVGRASGPNKEFLDRLREQSAREFENAPVEEPLALPHAFESPWRVFMKSKLFKVAAAVALVAIVAIVASQFVGGTNAYAQVVQEIRNARTMVWTLVRQANDGSGKTINVDVAYKDPGHLRTSTVDGYIAILDANTGKMISIVPQGGYTLGDLSGLSKTNNSPFADVETMKALPAKADLQLAAKDIDGVECDGYQVNNGDMTTTVWLDTKSGDLLQVEHKYASAPGMNTIMKNIKLDVPLEDTLFSLAPPAGYKEWGSPMMKDEPVAQTEKTFVEWLGWWTNSTVDEMFPPMVAGAEIAKAVMDMAKQGKLKPEPWQKADANPRMLNALMFVATLPRESGWRYTGNGVKINTPDTAIFWYKPAGKELYRVVYADLSIKELSADQLPK